MAVSPRRSLKAATQNRLDRIPRQFDPLLAAEQLQQYEHSLVRTQGSEQSNLILQRALQNLHPHAPA